jgi:tRNA1(Val) A37 N6-methylase TrmN6
MPKSTMYRPQMSKMITQGAEYVLDPCAGWGGRMLGAVANGAHYIAFEPNTTTFDNLTRMIDFLGIKDNVTLYCDDARNIDNYDIPEVDVILTSPPYFDLEIYCKDNTQSVHSLTTYEDWDANFLTPIITKCIMRLKDEGKSCWNVANFGKIDMWASVNKAHNLNGFNQSIIYENKSSKRPTDKNKSSDKKSDITISYTRS